MKTIVSKTIIFHESNSENDTLKLLNLASKALYNCGDRIILNYFENPVLDEQPGTWKVLNSDYFELIAFDREFSLGSMLPWLRQGNWQLYCGSDLDSDPPIFEADTVLDDQLPQGVRLCIQAFHDMEWVTLTMNASLLSE